MSSLPRLLLVLVCLSVSACAADLSTLNIPLDFEKNEGQLPPKVDFSVHSEQGVFFLTRDGIALEPNGREDQSAYIRFTHGLSAAPAGELPTGGSDNYYRPKQKDWVKHVPLFGRVRYANAHPGVDVVVHANQQNLEFDFEVAPGASVADLGFEVQSVDQISVTEDGALTISAGSDRWMLPAPVAYQALHGERQRVKSYYRLLSDNKVAICVDKFDHTSKLIIDPVVEYSLIRTYGNSNISALQVDGDGNIFIVGVGNSTTYPVLNGNPPNPSGAAQLFLTKINGTTKAVMFSTYLPATFDSSLSGMTFDPQGNIYLTGITDSSDFPVTSTNLGTCGSFCNVGFVTKFAPDGSMVYSTLIASGQVLSRAIAVDAGGNAYITGNADDNSLLTTPDAYEPTYQGLECTSCSNAFFAKLNPSGTGYVYSSYLNGAGTAPSLVGTGIALDSSGNIYIGGAGIPNQLVQPWESVQGPFFLAKFASDGRTLQFATTFGTASNVFPRMKIGPDGTIYFVSSIESNDFPYTVNAAFHPTVPNDTSQFRESIFAMAIDPGLKGLKYSTYLGDGLVNDFTVDSRNHLYLTASSQGRGVPLFNPVVSGVSNANFFAELDSAGNPVTISEFGSRQTAQLPNAIAVDSNHSIYLAGSVSGGRAPFGPDPLLVGPLCDGVPGGNGAPGCAYDGSKAALFIAKINDANNPELAVTSPGPPYLGLFPPFLLIRNAGSSDLHISNIALSSGVSQEFDNCGTVIPAGVLCILSVTDGNGQVAGGTVTITSDAQPGVQSFNLVPPTFTPTQPIGDSPVFEDISFIFAPQLLGTSTPAIPVRIWNLGRQNSQIDQVLAFGDVLQTNNCAVITPGANCTVQVSVTPRTSDAINQLGIVYDTGGLRQNYFIWSVLAPQSLLLSVQSLGFGHQLVGGTAIPRTVTVTNTTNAVLPVPAVSIQGDSQFLIDGNSCISPLPAYGSCAVGVQYIPTHNGDSNGTLTVASGGTVHADLFATGEIDSVVRVSPLQLDFNSWPVGHSLPSSLQLTNSASSSVSITSIAVSPSDFTQTNDCGGQLPAGGSCTLQVNFAPTTLGPENGTVTVNFASGVAQQVILLTGTGVLPLDISVSSLDFGSVIPGQTSPSQGVSIGNGRPIGPQAYILSVTGDFSVSQNGCPNPEPPFVGCAVQVSFAPTQVGPRQGTLTISFPGLSVQGTVALSGIGTGPILQVSTPADLGQQLVGTAMEHDIALSNGGDSVLTISSYSVTGANSAEFQVASGQCQTIDPSAVPCNLKINFAPSAPGTRTATLEINDNSSGSPHAIVLVGTATASPFAFTLPSGSSTVTVRAGATATYNFSVSRTPGFSGIVQLACSGIPAHSNCLLQPASLDLTSASSASFTAQISTTGPSAALSSSLGFLYLGFVFVPLVPGLWSGRRLLLICLLFALVLFVSCGGGSSSSSTPPPPPSGATPSGTYQITITGTSGALNQSTTLTLVVQ